MPATPKIRRSYRGAPVQAALGGSGVTSATATSISLSSAPSTWPTGKFFVFVAPGTASEEKMCVTLSGSTMTVVDPNVSSTAASVNGRGVDNTTARTTIAAGSVVYPVATAIDFDEANQLTSTYANQGGLVYMGDPSFTQLGIGTAGQVLRVNTGATAPEWGQVGTAGIADGAVTSGKIQNGTITDEDVSASAAITLTKLANGALPTGITVASANLVDGTIVEADLADGAVTSAKILNDTIVDADINASAAIADTKLATISTVDKVSAPALNIKDATAIGADLADGDSIVVYDLSATANRNTALSRFAKFLFSKISGDITVSDAGVATTKSWTTWTPTLSGLGAGTTTARFIQTGKTVHFTFRHVFTTSTTVTATGPTFTLPVAARAGADIEGRFLIALNDVSALTAYTSVGWQTNASTVRINYSGFGTLGTTIVQVDSTAPFGWANGDIISCYGTYEAA